MVSMTGDRLRLLAGFETAVERHLRAFFAGHELTPHVWTAGPMRALHAEFRVLEIAPGPKTPYWTYVSAGGTVLSQPDAEALEFALIAPASDMRNVEIITMAAHYNYLHALGEGHTVPIGDPWLEGSPSDHLLVCKPYPFGPEFEHIDAPEGRARILWLLPITEAERDFKVANGLDALESRFEEARLEYWRADRPSIC